MTTNFVGTFQCWLGLMVIGLSILVQAQESSEADAWVLRLRASEKVEDFQQVEEWVFEEDLGWEAVTDRMGQAFKFIDDLPNRSVHRNGDELLLKRYVKNYGDSWQVLAAAAKFQDELSSRVVLNENGWVRVQGWREGEAGIFQRDEIQSIQFLLKASELAEKEGADGDQLAALDLRLAERIQRLEGDGSVVLTNLDELPGPTTNGRKYWEKVARLGMDGEGRLKVPVLRGSFTEARNDEERRYFLLDRALKRARDSKGRVELALANFWYELFGVDQLANADYLYLRGTESEFDEEAPGEFELHTLNDHETFVVGPDGPKRVVLPEHCQFVSMLQKMALDEGLPKGIRWDAAGVLTYDIFPDRRQVDRAHELAVKMGTRKLVNNQGEEYEQGLTVHGYEADARMSGGGPIAHGVSPPVFIYSRGLSEVELELWQIDVLKRIKGNFGDLGDMITGGGSEAMDKELKVFQEWLQKKCEFKKKWNESVRMKPRRMQSKTRVDLGELSAGHYVLIRKEEESWEVLKFQIHDVALIHGENVNRLELDEEPEVYAVDPKTGQALEGVEIRSSSGEADSIVYSVSDHLGKVHGVPSEGRGLVRRPGGDWLFVIWRDDDNDQERWEPGEMQSFLTTSQPLYRPGQKVSMAGWLRRAPEWMGLEETLPEGLPVRIEVTDPSGRRVWQGEDRLDEFGGFNAEFQLGDEIVLGKYRVKISCEEGVENEWDELEDLSIPDSWDFEVGEFRKPDFQVKMELVEEGKGFELLVEANYLSGEPVKGAKVKTVFRGSPVLSRIYPKRKWDDLFGAGYEWGQAIPKQFKGWREWTMWADYLEDFYDELWYEQLWGSKVNSQLDGVTGEDGKVSLKFQAEFPLIDKYAYALQVSASVAEFTGRVVTREKWLVHTGRDYEVFARPKRGFYRSGEPIEVEVGCLNSRRELVAGKGILKIERVVKGKFEPVLERKVELGDDSLDIVIQGGLTGGQYRCLFDGGGSQRGVLLEVLGENGTEGSYRGVELIPRDYLTDGGEVLEVLVRTAEPSATVWIFEKQPNGVGRSPRKVTTKNHTATLKIPVIEASRPNFVLDALVFWKGKTMESRCVILVPDRKSRLDLEMKVAPEENSPGGDAKVEVKVNDYLGKGSEASLALTVFDRALEDMAGSLPSTSILRKMSYLDGSAMTSLGDDWSNEYGELYENGVFSDRGGFCAETLHEAESRFMKPGEALWNTYEPPELPNQVGGGIGLGPAASGGGVAGGGFVRSEASPAYVPREAELYAGEVGQSGKVRKRFVDQAFWGGALRTDKEGRVMADFELPDNLTSWRVQSWAFGRGRSFGDAELELPVSKPLQVRPLLPRAAVVGDELVVGAMVQNSSDGDQEILLILEAEGVAVLDQGARKVSLKAGEEGRAMWRVQLEKAGGAIFRVSAKSVDGTLEDGFESRVPVASSEVMTTVSDVAVIDRERKISELRLPFDPAMVGRKVEFCLEANPAVSALAVLPDLVEYPHGCAEQTLNRFLPLLVAWDSQLKLGLDWEAMTKFVNRRDGSLGWISGRMGAGLAREETDLSEEQVENLVHVGVSRLGDLQNDDGSWGWFSKDDPNQRAYLTALAVRGLAKAARVEGERKKQTSLRSGKRWLEGWAELKLDDQSSKRLLVEAAFAGWALREAGSEDCEKLTNQLWGLREVLPLMARIHLALSLEDEEKVEKLADGIRPNLPKGDLGTRGYVSWWDQPVEQWAYFLELLVKVDAPKEELRAGIQRLLGARRDGIRWKSTRESGVCIEAIVSALVRLGFDPFAGSEATRIEVKLEGAVSEIALVEEKLWAEKIELPIDGPPANGGKELVFQITRRGNVRTEVYLNAAVSHPSNDPKDKLAEDEGLDVKRIYSRVTPDGERELVKEGEEFEVGNIIEVSLLINSEGERSFVHLRDPIPAGMEPLMPLSGYRSGAYQEGRTGESHFFISSLDDRSRRHRYLLSVVTEGTSLALPAQAECMYSPEIRGQSGARKVVVKRD